MDRNKSRPRASIKILLLATQADLPYRVLRCADAAATVFVLGTPQARGLAESRYCERFFDATSVISTPFDMTLADEINTLVELLGVDMILPGDGPATRSLISIREHLAARCFPMPPLETFDLLNDKWRFGELCTSLGIQHPVTRLFADKQALIRDIDAGSITFPVIAKPLSMSGSLGCVPMQGPSAHQQALEINYEPIIVQDFIDGFDIGSSIYCESGEIKLSLNQCFIDGRYEVFLDDDVLDPIIEIVGHLNLDGVYNFDLRSASGGRKPFLECNPRFFFTMHMAMLAGANFVAAGLPGAVSSPALVRAQPRTIYSPAAALAGLRTPRTALQKSWPAIDFWLSDPIPILRKRGRPFPGHHSRASESPSPGALNLRRQEGSE